MPLTVGFKSIKSEIVKVTSYKCVARERTENVTVMVPHQVQKDVQVRVCHLVEKKVMCRVWVPADCNPCGPTAVLQ